MKKLAKKLWYYLWEDEGIIGWIVTVIVSFIFVKFILLPGLGLLLGTPFPVVAVVSSSMDHNGVPLEEWIMQKEQEYQNYNLSTNNFTHYVFQNGFNKGDVIVLKRAKNLQVGDVIVFQGRAAYPIIHRIVQTQQETYTTKGDNNVASRPDETNIPAERVYGKAWLRLPYLGRFKIIFVTLLSLVKLT